MRNLPSTQIVTHTQIVTAFFVSRKCDYLEALQLVKLYDGRKKSQAQLKIIKMIV